MTIDTSGASSHAFARHPGYRRMFAPGALTIGIFLPLRFYQGDMRALAGQADLVAAMDRLGFAAAWVRDIPLYDRRFGDAGQLFDPWVYLAYLAARTDSLALATGSAIFTLRHPVDLAKAAASIDQLSGGRLVLGTASGDRAGEFPAYGVPHETRGERYAQAVHMFRQLLRPGAARISGPLGSLDGLELLPKPAAGTIPLIVTSSSGQPLAWIGRHADGWLTYPEATDTPEGPRRLAEKIRAWRQCIPDGGFRPHMCNEWLDLVDDADYPRTPVRSGYVLRTGRKGLIELLGEWRAAGVNHAALGIQHGQRPAVEVLQELAEEVLPHFPSHAAPPGAVPRW